jgi:hypothetical protein
MVASMTQLGLSPTTSAAMEYGHKLRRPDPSPEEIAQKMSELRKRKDDAMAPPPKVQEADPMDWRRGDTAGGKSK